MLETVALAVGAHFLYNRLGGGEIGMRKIWAVLLAVSLGVGLSACSKCDMPVLMPKSCKGGTGPSQTLTNAWADIWAGNWALTAPAPQ